METDRLGFSRWCPEDGELAWRLWGEPAVTRWLCASGIFSREEVAHRLELEMRHERECGVQYWPVFLQKTGEFAGCCGLRPRSAGVYELGAHFRPEYWGRGYGTEAGRAVIRHAFSVLGAGELFAGHHPENTASQNLLGKLGFVRTGEELYPPTGLLHPPYRMEYPESVFTTLTTNKGAFRDAEL